MKLSHLVLRLTAVSCLLLQPFGCDSEKNEPTNLPYVSLRGPVNYLGNTSYMVDVEIGTPPQTVSLVLDNGSSTLVVNSKDCPVCAMWNPGAPTFDSASSSTWQASACNETNCPKPECKVPSDCEPVQGCHQCYGETSDCQFCAYYENNFGGNIGNWGVWGSDVVRVGQVETEVHLGVIRNLYNKDSVFGPHSSGIFGMQLEVFNNVLADRNKTYPTFMNRAVDGSGVTGLPFSLCLTDDGGTLLLGEKDTAHMLPGTEKVVPYGKSAYDEGQAIADFDGFQVNGHALNIAPDFYASQPVDFDSGTGPWTMLDTFYDALKSQFCEGSTATAACEGVRDDLFAHKCVILTDDTMASLPKLKSIIGGQEFILEPREYLLRGASAAIATSDATPCPPDEYTLGFASTKPSPNPGFGVSLFGAVWMRNFTMYFDTPNKHVVIARQRGCVVDGAGE